MTITTPLRQCAAALLLCLLAASAGAKIPAPQLTDEQKLKAAEAAARTAWSNQVANFQLCRSMDKVAARYFAEAKTAAKEVKPAVPAGDCSDPGPFAFKAPEVKPIEAAGAHSPPETSKGPPSTMAPAAQTTPAPATKKP
jgi:hypothetical protein